VSCAEKILKADNISEFLSIWLENDFLSPDLNKTLSNYYRSYKRNFDEYMRYHYTNQTVELMDTIASMQNPKVLEVGCGCGTESLWMAMNGANVTAIDIDEPMLCVANERKRIIEKETEQALTVTFFKKSVLDIDTSDKFNIVWVEQAFHHLEPRAQVLEKLRDLVKPGGYLIISETNAWNPLVQLLLFKWRGFKTIIKVDGHIWGNERILTPCKLKKLLKNQGFVNIKKRMFRIFPNSPFLIRIAKKMKNYHNVPSSKGGRGIFAPMFTHYNLICRAP
jgi:2-polyprenyl-3-methyl-5-hydroxy-6-metoxy-1,4-benzoquinol methylase